MPARPRRSGRNASERGAAVSDALLALVQFPNHDYAWLAHFFTLLFLPFAHEDLAIILGGYIVVNKIMPLGLVVASIYGGMVASDFALYGIGAGARRLPWLTRFAVDDRVRNFAEVLQPTWSVSRRSAVSCRASCSLPSSRADGRACRSAASPLQALWSPRSTCRSCCTW